MKGHRRTLPWVLMALGALMALAALGMLSQVRGALQYCVLAPQAGEKGEELKKLADGARKLDGSMKDVLSYTALGGFAAQVSLSAGDSAAQASLYAVGEGWLEVYPRFIVRGRRFGESEIGQGERVAMLDEGLAFRLFGAELPEDARMKLNDAEFRVVGTLRHGGSVFGGRGVGDVEEYDVYVPLMAAQQAGVALDTLTLSALPAGGSGAAQLFEEAARNQWLAGGDMIDLDKEVMRRTVLPRSVVLVVGLYILVGLFIRMTRLAALWIADFRSALKAAYFKKLIWRLAGISAMTLLGYAALIAATGLLMAFSVQPLYVFTEYVPESIVEPSSISKVFWALTGAAAAPVRLGTCQLRTVEFWGGVLRWGTLTALLGAALMKKQPLARKGEDHG